MVNYLDPAVVQQYGCAYAFIAKYMSSGANLPFFDSCNAETLACCGWIVLVSQLRRALDSDNISNNNNPVLISSLEFVTTLDYEWSVIRDHRPFGWTIWGRINALFLLGIVAQSLSRLADLLHSVSAQQSYAPEVATVKKVRVIWQQDSKKKRPFNA